MTLKSLSGIPVSFMMLPDDDDDDNDNNNIIITNNNNYRHCTCRAQTSGNNRLCPKHILEVFLN